MPSDANGVYSLPSGYEATTGEIIQASQHNPPLEDLASAMSARLMRSGAAPMTGPLKIADGSVGSPGLKFSSDGTSGIYKTVNGFGVSIGGVKVAEFTSGGVSRYLGELIPFTGLTAQALTVFPYGQTLSRAAYADLWAFAQTEIAGGNTFYNNGDGSTTFGIGDMRGRVVAGKDNMGGAAAGLLTSSYFGANGTVLGASGGAQARAIAQANLPNVAPTFVGNSAAVNVTTDNAAILAATAINAATGIQGGGSFSLDTIAAHALTTGPRGSSGSFTPTGFISSINGGVSQTLTSLVQPTLVCNYLLYAGA